MFIENIAGRIAKCVYNWCCDKKINKSQMKRNWFYR